jgi:uncharacterized membrane protein
MMTLLLLLAILIGSFGVLSAADSVKGPDRMGASRRGQISLALLFLFTGVGHFVQTDQMVQMLPPWVPVRTGLIWASGMLEWLLALGLLTPRYSRVAGLCAMTFLVLVFPGNVYAAINRVDMGGHGAGPAYLLVRAPFQLLLMAWAYWFAVRQEPRVSADPEWRAPG